MDPTTPTVITPKLLALAESRNSKTPVFVPVVPESWAEKGDCFKNAQRYCDEHQGAARVFGFLIRSNGVWAEAEYHAVVRLPSGELMDPTQEGTERILFAEIEDERSRATGIHAVALIQYSVVTEFVEIYNKGHKGLEDGAVFDETGARKETRFTRETADLLRLHEVALQDVKKAFKNRWPTF